MIAIKRAYEPASASDGKRYLVERLWPRGIRKEELRLDGWLKDVAPSAELRKWYGHEVAKWPQFHARYRKELEANPEGLDVLRAAAKRGRVTLVYAAKDEEHNSALVLRDLLARDTRRRKA